MNANMSMTDRLAAAADALDRQADALAGQVDELRREAASLRAHAALPDRASSLLSIKEACALSGLTKFALRQMLADGRLAEMRVGRRRFVSRVSVEALGRAS